MSLCVCVCYSDSLFVFDFKACLPSQSLLDGFNERQFEADTHVHTLTDVHRFL